jgi:UPF0755 protein
MRRIIIGVLAVLVVCAAVAGVLYGRVDKPFKGFPGGEQFVVIQPGEGPARIGRRLVDSGVVRDRLTWRLALTVSGAARRLKAGEYRFTQELSPRAVIAKIERGEVYLRPITFPEGLTIAEMARLFESRGFGSAADFERAANDPSTITALDPEAPNLEGYLFPETYGLPRGATAAALVQQMTKRFLDVFGQQLRDRASERGLSVRQAVTLASLVEKETGKPEERPIVAAVYVNRLAISMPLQCDPTVIYGLQRAGRYTGNLTRDDLAFDSPYNTYKYPGLPPGPIAAPGRASLEAALHPAEVDYLYFVSRNDGSHVFARTYDEHRRNVQEYQVRFFRERAGSR